VTRYEFVVEGILSSQGREALCDMRIEPIPTGARCSGDVIDDSHLLGILAQFRALRLVVISAHRSGAGMPRPRSRVREPGPGQIAVPASAATVDPSGGPSGGTPRDPA